MSILRIAVVVFDKTFGAIEKGLNALHRAYVAIVGAIFSIVLTAWILLSLFHFANGFDIVSALGAPKLDIQVLMDCWGDEGTIMSFIARDDVQGEDPGELLMALGMCG